MSNDTSKRWELIKQAEQNVELHKQALSLEDISNYWGSMTPEQQNTFITGGGAAAVAGIGTALTDDEEEGRAGRILRNTLLGAGAGYLGTQAYNRYSPAAQADETSTSTDAAPTPVADDTGGDFPSREQSSVSTPPTPPTPQLVPTAPVRARSVSNDVITEDDTAGDFSLPQDRTTVGGDAYALKGPAALRAAASATLPPWMQAVGAAGQMAGPADSMLGITPQLKSISRGLTDPSSAPPPAAEDGWKDMLPENLYDKKGSAAISFGQRMAKQAVGKKRNRRKVLIGPDGKASVRGGAKKKSVKKKTRKYKGNEKQGQDTLLIPGGSLSMQGISKELLKQPRPSGMAQGQRKQPLPKHRAGASYRPKTHVDHPDFKKDFVGAPTLLRDFLRQHPAPAVRSQIQRQYARHTPPSTPKRPDRTPKRPPAMADFLRKLRKDSDEQVARTIATRTPAPGTNPIRGADPERTTVGGDAYNKMLDAQYVRRRNVEKMPPPRRNVLSR